MNATAAKTDWLAEFPRLHDISDHVWQSDAGQAVRMQVKRDTVLFRDGDACQAYVLVISGSVRVQKMDPQGHEMVLYRVEEGQSCMLTTTCLLGARSYPAEGIAESDVDLVMLPLKVFDHALAGSEGFRRFVMNNIGDRVCDLMMLLEDVAFGRMDVRLARLLLKNVQQSGHVLGRTHRELSVELGTAREVISRLLKSFERKGFVEL
ncbi:MAG: Crp/Fnr family transcriptional regulator, partial [Mariprofundaceae bacterium]